MNRVHSWSAGQKIASADLNTIQDNALGLAQVANTFLGPRPYLSNVGDATIHIGPIGGVALPTGSISVIRSNTSEITLATTGLTSSTWYYVYLYDTGSAIGAVYNTTAPDTTLRFQFGDPTKVYAGPFYVNSGGQIQPFRARSGRYVFRASGGGIGDPTLILSGTATTATLVNVKAPPHVRLVTLNVLLGNNSETSQPGALIWNADDADTGFGEITYAPKVDAGTGTIAYGQRDFTIECSAAQQIKYKLTASGPSVTINQTGLIEL